MTKNDLLIKQMEKKKMSITDLAYFLGIREATVYNWIRPQLASRRPIRKPTLIALSKIFKTEDFVKEG